MSASETLIAEPVMAAQTPAMPEDAMYTYHRADGTVEWAMSAEDAIVRCPVLGRLALEAPDEADLLLEMTAIGSADMGTEPTRQASKIAEILAAEPRSKPEPKTDLKLTPPYRVTPARRAIPVSQEPQQVQSPGHIEQPSKPTASYEPPETAKLLIPVHEEAKPLPALPPILIGKKTAVRPRHQVKASAPKIQPKPAAPVAVSRVKHERHVAKRSQTVEMPIVRSQPEVGKEKPPVVKSVRSLPSEQSENKPPLSREYAHTALPAARRADETTVLRKPVGGSMPAVQESPVAFPVVVTVPHIEQIETDGQQELPLEPEAIDTYDELLAVIEDDAVVASYEKIITVDAPAPAFETFLAAQPQPLATPPLERIVGQADEQPLEQTLVQLAQYLKASKIVPEQHPLQPEVSDTAMSEPTLVQAELQALLRDLADVVPVYADAPRATNERHHRVAPEITQKVLILLRSIGYQQPNEVLVRFVRLYGLAFLLEALRYMYLISEHDNLHELYPVSSPVGANDDNLDSHSVLGKLALLLFGNAFAFE